MAKDGDQLYPIAVLIDELRNEDVQVSAPVCKSALINCVFRTDSFA